jgi:GNAT superfamily N-acetyltransferase
MIRQCRLAEIEQIYTIINEAARAYDGKIPPDCYHQPYMPRPELEREMQRLTFYGWYENGVPVGVMGIEESKEVTLIRHAYVLPQWQNKGIGSGLLKHLMALCRTERLLVGTWAANTDAIRLYARYGFSLQQDKDKLLKAYWAISDRQIETSVVLERK